MTYATSAAWGRKACAHPTLRCGTCGAYFVITGPSASTLSDALREAADDQYARDRVLKTVPDCTLAAVMLEAAQKLSTFVHFERNRMRRDVAAAIGGAVLGILLQHVLLR